MAYFPAFLEPRRVASKLAAVVQQTYGQGVSPRFVDDLVKAMGNARHFQSQAGWLCEEIDEKVKISRGHSRTNGPIWGSTQPMRRREKNRLVIVAAIVSIGVDADARRREVLALG